MTPESMLVEAPSLRDRVQSLRLPSRADGGGNARGGWLPWTLTLLLALSTVSLAARVYTAPTPTSSATAASEPGAASGAQSTGQVPASADTAKGATGSVVLESKGYLIAAHQIQVSPIEVSGLVKELCLEEGKRFKKGDVLAILDTTSFESDVADARANLAGAGHRLADSEEQFRKAYLDFKRAQDLRSSGGLAVQDFEQAEMTHRAMEQRVAAAKADIDAAKARLRKAEWRLSNCTIRAPVSGTILKKSTELGNLVSPLSFNVSASLCEMADLSDIEVELDITERDIAKVAKGMPCKVRAEAYPDRIYDGVVDRLMPIANRAKGALPVRVKVRVPLDEEGVFLRPEMGAVVSFLQPEKKN
jgi:RND family efflux transporter MFP subunit